MLLPVAVAADGTAKHSCSPRVLFHAPVPRHCPLCSVAGSKEKKEKKLENSRKKIRISLIKMLTHLDLLPRHGAP